MAKLNFPALIPSGWVPTVRVKLFIFLCVVSLLPLFFSMRALLALGNRSTRTLREIQVKEGVDNALMTIQAMQNRLTESARAVAAWEELSRYLLRREAGWPENNLVSWVPQSYQLDYLKLCDPQGAMIYQWASSEAEENLWADSSLVHSDSITSGLISTPRNLYLLAKGTIPAQSRRAGYIIFGRKINHRFLMEMKGGRDQDIMVYYGGKLLATTDTTSSLPLVDPTEIFANLIQRQEAYLYHAQVEDRMIGFKPLRNLQGIEVAALGWTYSQAQAGFVQESIRKMLYFFGLPLLGLILCAALILGLWIERPIRELSKTMETVTRTGDLSRRATVSGGGEMELIALSFNQMLEQLAHQRDELMTFRTMILAMKEGVLIEDVHHQVVYMNPRMEELLGIALQSGAELSQPLCLGGRFTLKRQIVEDKRGFSTEEVEWIRPDGKRLQALKTSGPIADPHGKITGTLSTLVDVTERNELEIELIQASRMAFLGIYSQGIIHNLNGPLNTILGFSSLWCRNNPEAEIPARIRNDAQRMADLIASLGRRWHRTGQDRTTLLNLNEILQEELRFLEADLFFKNNVEKHLELDADLPGLYGVYGDFSHAFLNIFINAIEALTESAVHQLTVRTAQVHGDIVLEVEDTGIGIQAEDLDRIFLPFFSTKSRDRKDGIPCGAGLGLPIARKVLEPYGVKFSVRSEVRQGTCVTLRIPLREGSYFSAESANAMETSECLI